MLLALPLLLAGISLAKLEKATLLVVAPLKAGWPEEPCTEATLLADTPPDKL